MKNALILRLQKEETEMPDKPEKKDPGNEVPAEAEAGLAVKEESDPVEGEEEEEVAVDPDVD